MRSLEKFQNPKPLEFGNICSLFDSITRCSLKHVLCKDRVFRFESVASLAWVPGFRGTPRFWKEGSGTPQFCEANSRNYLLLRMWLVIEILKLRVLVPWFSGKVRFRESHIKVSKCIRNLNVNKRLRTQSESVSTLTNLVLLCSGVKVKILKSFKSELFQDIEIKTRQY